MYSPIKDVNKKNNNVRIGNTLFPRNKDSGINVKKHIVKGIRYIKKENN